MNLAPRIALVLVLVPFASIGAVACKSSGSPPASQPANKRVELTSEYTATATVVAIAPADRRVRLRREDGLIFDVRCGEAVRNFDRIAVGDTVRARYIEELGVERCAPGTATELPVAAAAAARAPKGELPAAGMGVGVTMRVRIESLDQAAGIVVYSLASGELVAHRAKTPEGRDFLRTLQVGDIVQVDYAEAAALTVEKT